MSEKPDPSFPPLAFQCPLKWENMAGDQRQRFCEQCQHKIHNLSEMTADERRALLDQSQSKLCVAYHVDPQGRPVESPAAAARARAFKTAATLSLAAAPAFLAACSSAPEAKEKPPNTYTTSEGREFQIFHLPAPATSPEQPTSEPADQPTDDSASGEAETASTDKPKTNAYVGYHKEADMHSLPMTIGLICPLPEETKKPMPTQIKPPGFDR